MFIVLVYVHVKNEFIDEFKQLTLYNAQNSVKEPGIARFDVIQQTEDPSRFILVEVYRNSEAAANHKTTDHYLTWRDKVADMMAEPRQGVKFINVFPDEEGWG